MVKAIVFSIAVCWLSGFAVANDVPDDVSRLEEWADIEVPGLDDQPVTVARCYRTTLFKKDPYGPEESVRRWLCKGMEGDFAFYQKTGYQTDGTSIHFLVDMSSEEWIRIGQVADIESRGPDEEMASWLARIINAYEDNQFHLDVETGTRLFNSTDMEVVERARVALWEELKVSDPALAKRIEWILGTLSGCSSSPRMITLIQALDNQDDLE